AGEVAPRALTAAHRPALAPVAEQLGDRERLDATARPTPRNEPQPDRRRQERGRAVGHGVNLGMSNHFTPPLVPALSRDRPSAVGICPPPNAEVVPTRRGFGASRAGPPA